MAKQQLDITITGQTFENFYQQKKNLCGQVKEKGQKELNL